MSPKKNSRLLTAIHLTKNTFPCRFQPERYKPYATSKADTTLKERVLKLPEAVVCLN
jgi:hypothetical protein